MVRQYTKSAAFVLMHVAAAWFASTEAATSCKMLSGHDSILATAIKDMAQMPDSDFSQLSLKQVFGEVDAQFPWLSQCAAAMDPSVIVTQVTSSTTLSKCSKRLEQQQFPESFTSQTMKDVVCPFYKSTIVPCIIDGIVDIVVRAMKNSDGCCDPMLPAFQQWFGDDVPTMADKLLQHVGNIICPTRTTESSSTPQYCAQAIVNAFSQVDMDMSVALNLGQIPNSQVCDALAGNTFVNTAGAKTKFSIASGNDIGICFQPIDYLLRQVRNYPLMKTGTMVYDSVGASVAVSDLFADGKCINANLLVQWVGLLKNPAMTFFGVIDGLESVLEMSSDSSSHGSYSNYRYTNLTISVPNLLESIEGYAKGLCIHLPNDAPCAYSGETIAYPYTAVALAAQQASAAVTTSGLGAFQTLAFVVAVVVIGATTVA